MGVGEGEQGHESTPELEDTLKAGEDPGRRRRNVSSPPGVSGDSEEEGDLVQPLVSTQEVQLRKNIPVSHSMDAITKVIHIPSHTYI